MKHTIRHRNWAALGLAAAMAAPLGVAQFSRLYAQDAARTGDRPAQAVSDQEMVKLGRDQFDKRQYEQAEKTLTAVRTAHLSEKDREAYLTLMTDVKHAAIERRKER